MRRLRHVAAVADPVPSDAEQVARGLLTWRTVDGELASLLGAGSGGEPPPDAAAACGRHAP